MWVDRSPHGGCSPSRYTGVELSSCLTVKRPGRLRPPASRCRQLDRLAERPGRALQSTSFDTGSRVGDPVASWPAPIHDGGWQVPQDCCRLRCAGIAGTRGFPATGQGRRHERRAHPDPAVTAEVSPDGSDVRPSGGAPPQSDPRVGTLVRDRQSYPWQILRMIERLSGSSGLEG